MVWQCNFASVLAFDTVCMEVQVPQHTFMDYCFTNYLVAIGAPRTPGAEENVCRTIPFRCCYRKALSGGVIEG